MKTYILVAITSRNVRTSCTQLFNIPTYTGSFVTCATHINWSDAAHSHLHRLVSKRILPRQKAGAKCRICIYLDNYTADCRNVFHQCRYHHNSLHYLYYYSLNVCLAICWKRTKCGPPSSCMAVT